MLPRTFSLVFAGLVPEKKGMYSVAVLSSLVSEWNVVKPILFESWQFGIGNGPLAMYISPAFPTEMLEAAGLASHARFNAPVPPLSST
eukprot:765453-Hanusia_phi.AAC.1